MILLFGGTTEGVAIARLLNIINQPYIYHTKTATKQKVDSLHLYGALTCDDMVEVFAHYSINLIIDAGHPFAVQLHENVSQAAIKAGIESIRFERKFPVINDESVSLFSSFQEVERHLTVLPKTPVLALTGVQTIKHFSVLWDKMPMHFRILDTELSMQTALDTGIKRELIHPAPPHITKQSLIELIDKIKPKILITKESGESGYFSLKQEVAKKLGISLWVVSKPVLPEYNHTFNEIRDLHQRLLKIRKDFWKDETNLKSGFTTGTCVTAAAKAAFLALQTGSFPAMVEIVVPSGKTAHIAIYPGSLTENMARCTVVKDAGDDPDVTHAAIIGCSIELKSQTGIDFRQGRGVGTVTLPGLQVKPGQPAINNTPRKMISEVIVQLSDMYDYTGGVIVTPFVPMGEELAQKTFNPRVGVIGGISIIGTSGEVKPLSHAAFINAIEQQIKVVAAIGLYEIVSTAGLRSENIVKERFKHLPQQAFIHHGNFIGDTLKLAVKHGIKKNYHCSYAGKSN
jgi:cobalt-precorrin-5B (C1)-methyltransferase